MELIFILLWMVVAFLGDPLWVLRKTYGSFHQILKKLPDRIPSGLGVVGVRKLKNIQEDFFRLKQQLSISKVLATTAGKISQQC